MTRAVYQEWFPQVWLDEHQMGSTGPRIFVPPYAEPVSTEIHPLVWREVNLIGSNMALRLEQAGQDRRHLRIHLRRLLAGRDQEHRLVEERLGPPDRGRFGAPGHADRRSPRASSSAAARGSVEYGPQTNFPDPWPGGVWHLRDIMDYERLASDALLEDVLRTARGLPEDMATRTKWAMAPFGPHDAFRIPMGASQRDRAAASKLAQIMAEHGVEVKTADNGDIWIALAQPYGRFVREMFTTQRYPEVKLVPGKDIVRPYDVAAWTMPMMMGVSVERAPLPDSLRPFAPAAPALSTDGIVAIAPGSPENARLVNAALHGKGTVSILRGAVQAGGKSWPAGTIFLDADAAKAAAGKAVPGVSWTSVSSAPAGVETMKAPRVGLYKPWAASMDEGWTRWILEQYGFDSKSLDNKAIKAGKLSDFDVIILPDVSKEVIATGKPRVQEGGMKYFAELPPEYAGGIEKEGAKALHEFVEAGGTIVAFAAATEWVTDEFNIPVLNTIARVRPEDFGCPGSLLRVNVAPNTPLTYGLPDKLTIFQDKPIAFETAPPASDLTRWILASYPSNEQDILASGWIRGADRLEQARRRRRNDLRQGQARSARLPRPAPRPDPRDVPLPLQRPLLVDGEMTRRRQLLAASASLAASLSLAGCRAKEQGPGGNPEMKVEQTPVSSIYDEKGGVLYERPGPHAYDLSSTGSDTLSLLLRAPRFGGQVRERQGVRGELKPEKRP